MDEVPGRVNPLGVLQGRLLPKYKGRYQAHPVNYWQQEFALCQQSGLDCIEFILDYNDVKHNPLLTPEGRSEIKHYSQAHGVAVHSVCADYFMEAPLHRAQTSEASQKMLEKLLPACAALNIENLVIPCVDKSSFKNEAETEQFAKLMERFGKIAKAYNVNLALETDLAPAPFVDLLTRIDCDAVTVNYDIGNSASLGFDPTEEFRAYGEKITDVHIKDRKLNGGPEVLGLGDANFGEVFRRLRELQFSGPFIMQAYRDDEGLAIFQQQLDWIKPYLHQPLGEKS